MENRFEENKLSYNLQNSPLLSEFCWAADRILQCSKQESAALRTELRRAAKRRERFGNGEYGARICTFIVSLLNIRELCV